MKKFVNLCKKSLLIATSTVFLCFMIAVIVISCLPHGNEYVFKISLMGMTEKIVYDFKEDDTIEIKAYVNGVDVTKDMFGQDVVSAKYFIKGGTLFTVNGETVTRVGKINAYTIVLDSSNEEADMVRGMKLNCPVTCGLRDFSIAMIVISGLGAIGCVVVTVLDKKGKLKYKEAVTAEKVEAENPTQEMMAQDIVDKTEED